MSERPLLKADRFPDNVLIRKSRAALRIVVVISLATAVIFFTACSGVSNQYGNGGNGGGGGGNGGGTGGGNLACNGMSTGQVASLNGFVPFTSSNLWNTDISSVPVDPNSGAIITNWVGSVNVHRTGALIPRTAFLTLWSTETSRWSK